ncbi:FkbM family methyltransferase [Prosthecobacter sp. SYSU 5D2]|uniref:FkbM family methyltransferase n=1 Tax=Prosthecobacter sp. SYSU 5D2 TaxID=3134134 RepID=UPI0031FE5103
MLCLTNWREGVNYLDNFILGELRHPEVEKMLRSADAGEVIEVGVNVGITSRWWLTLNPDLHVIGIDMMQEALDYTGRCMSVLNLGSHWYPVLGAVGDAEGRMTVRFDDPMEGTNSLDNPMGGIQRTVEINTLDAYLQRAPMKKPLLLKLDIEGHASPALRGASSLLQTVRWVVVEIHHDEELAQSAELLTRQGFGLRHFYGRTMWWMRLD